MLKRLALVALFTGSAQLATLLALKFLANDSASNMSRWERFAQLLLVSNEMLCVD